MKKNGGSASGGLKSLLNMDLGSLGKGKNNGKSAAKGIKYPEKTYFNFSERPNKAKMSTRSILLIILAAVIVLAAGKLLVFDKFYTVHELEAQVATQQEYIDQLTQELMKFDKVQEDYKTYAVAWMNENELSKADRMEIVQLVEDNIMSKAKVHSISISENAASITMSGINLSQCYDIVAILQKKPFVSEVTVYTANSQESTSDALISMVVGLQNVPDEAVATEGGSDTTTSSNEAKVDKAKDIAQGIVDAVTDAVGTEGGGN